MAPPSADSNRATIRRLYEALDAHDGEAMAACYRPDGRFRDPAFGELDGREAGAMWRMLTGRADDLEVELVEHEAASDAGNARWIARYTFTATGRRVVNDVRSEFLFDPDGLISEQTDRFSFWRWSRQALGPIGLVLGWTPLLPALTRKRANADLDRFIADG
jgi:ketosteroid isomerase-like protein